MSKKFLKGAFLGAVAGAVSGLLLAPKSGKETRSDIKTKAVSTKDKAVDQADKAKDAVEEKAKNARRVIDELSAKVSQNNQKS
jgi:gas vesicle protein